MTDHDLRWLSETQPATAPPGAVATSRARSALMAHAATPAPTVTSSPEGTRRARPARRWQRPARVLALAGAAAVAVAAVGVLPFLGGAEGGLAPGRAEAAPLVRLAERVKAEPAPVGDATLVSRVQAYPDGRSMGGFDLYTDAGDYYYGATMADVRGAAARDESQGAFTAREVAAAADAADATDLEAARRRMLAATGIPIGPSDAAAPAVAAAATAATLEAKGMSAEAARAKAAGGHPASRAEREDNTIWGGTMDALIAGSGRSAVRAGVLRLMATIPTVDVSEEAAASGGADLMIRNWGFSDGYAETLIVDGDTGIPLKMVGGGPG